MTEGQDRCLAQEEIHGYPNKTGRKDGGVVRVPSRYKGVNKERIGTKKQGWLGG